MKYLLFLGAIFSMLILILQSQSVFAYNDPNHCRGYNACYAIGYKDGYNDGQMDYLLHMHVLIIAQVGAMDITSVFAFTSFMAITT